MSSITIKRYSTAFKKQVVKEYESGETIYALNGKYGINGSTTIKKWIEQFGRKGLRHKLMVIQQPEEQDRIKRLEAEVAQLKEALAQASLDNFMYQRLIEVAEQELGYELKKNESTKPLSKPKKFKKKQKKRS